MAVLLQHNWTGRLAMHAAFQTAALSLVTPVKGVNSTSSSKSSGRWLKSDHARLRLHASEGQACTLALHLQDHVLLSAQLSDAQLRLGVLRCEHTSVLLLVPHVQVSVARAAHLTRGSANAASVCAQDPSSAAPVTYAFSFFDQADCDGFTAALHAMLAKQQQQHAAAAEAAPQLMGDSGLQQRTEAKAAVKVCAGTKRGGRCGVGLVCWLQNDSLLPAAVFVACPCPRPCRCSASCWTLTSKVSVQGCCAWCAPPAWQRPGESTLPQWMPAADFLQGLWNKWMPSGMKWRQSLLAQGRSAFPWNRWPPPHQIEVCAACAARGWVVLPGVANQLCLTAECFKTAPRTRKCTHCN